ncbi:hypothetical protein ACJJTC_016168 [Scirpophaga incertulas]
MTLELNRPCQCYDYVNVYHAYMPASVLLRRTGAKATCYGIPYHHRTARCCYEDVMTLELNRPCQCYDYVNVYHAYMPASVLLRRTGAKATCYGIPYQHVCIPASAYSALLLRRRYDA